MKTIAKALAGLSLATCLVISYVHFQGWMGPAPYRSWLAIASVAWFVFATYGMSKRA
jgi:hypothetical protein